MTAAKTATETAATAPAAVAAENKDETLLKARFKDSYDRIYKVSRSQSISKMHKTRARVPHVFGPILTTRSPAQN